MGRRDFRTLTRAWPWICSTCLVVQCCPTLSDTMDSSPPGTSVHGDSPGKEYWSGLPCPLPGDLPNPGIESRSPALQANSLLSEPPVMPKNTGVSSLSLLQGIFLTQESNQGLLHCRYILYELSYQGGPLNMLWKGKHRLTFFQCRHSTVRMSVNSPWRTLKFIDNDRIF